MTSLRVYPTACTSAFCGKGPDSCPACPNYPALKEFKAWIAETGAVVTDPIWCPRVYEIPKPKEST